jgi:hypothetical protein
MRFSPALSLRKTDFGVGILLINSSQYLEQLIRIYPGIYVHSFFVVNSVTYLAYKWDLQAVLVFA